MRTGCGDRKRLILPMKAGSGGKKDDEDELHGYGGAPADKSGFPQDEPPGCFSKNDNPAVARVGARESGKRNAGRWLGSVLDAQILRMKATKVVPEKGPGCYPCVATGCEARTDHGVLKMGCIFTGFL